MPPPGAGEADASGPARAPVPPGAYGDVGTLAGHHGGAAPPAPDLDDRERTLDPRVVQVWRLVTALGLAIPLIPVSVLAVVLLGPVGAVVPVAATAPVASSAAA